MKENKPTSDLDHYLLEEMYLESAVGVGLQCNGEYWSESATDAQCATEIHKLSQEERKNIPTNNLNCERYLARFGYLAALSAAHSNKPFKAKRIRDDLMLLEDNREEVVRDSMKAVLKNLDEMEINWTEKQKEIKRKRLMNNLEKKVKANEFIDHILIKCKNLTVRSYLLTI